MPPDYRQPPSPSPENPYGGTPPGLDQKTLDEEAALGRARSEHLQRLKYSRNIALGAFSLATLALFAVWHSPSLPHPWLVAAGFLQLATLVYLATSSVFAIAYLYREYMTLDAIVTLSMAVFVTIFGMAVGYLVFGIEGSDKLLSRDYLHTLYFSVVTITTLGYGDYRPIGLAMLYAAVEAMVGYVLLGTFVGYIVAQMTRAESRISHSDMPSSTGCTPEP